MYDLTSNELMLQLLVVVFCLHSCAALEQTKYR